MQLKKAVGNRALFINPGSPNLFLKRLTRDLKSYIIIFHLCQLSLIFVIKLSKNNLQFAF
jgi:hypothetical protein